MEYNLNIKNIFWHIVRKWRAILICMLVFGVLLGVYKYSNYTKILNDEDLMYDYMLENFQASKDYIDEKNSLTKQVETLTNSVANDTKYYEESILMQINALNYYVGNLEIYVDSLYQIQPDKTYQDTDNIYKILKAYSSSIEYGDLYDTISDELGYEADKKYIKEIVTYSSNSQTGFITFTIKSNTVEENTQIANIIANYIDGKYYTVVNEIAEHQVLIYDPSVSSYIDTALNEFQGQFIIDLNADKSDLEYVESSLLYLKEPEIIEINEEYIVPITRNFAILGAILGAVLAVGFIAIYIIFLGKLQDEEIIEEKYKLSVFGVRPVFNEKRNFIDKIIYILSEQSQIKSNEEFSKYIDTSVDAYLDTNKIIHITGTIKEAEIQSVREMLKHCKTITAGSCVLEDAESLLNLKSADTIIFVEKKFKTNMLEFDKQYYAVQKLNKEIGGVIIL
ncbi:MAG: cysteine peptidase family C39 domain-containing protein [Clostridia bacterium]